MIPEIKNELEKLPQAQIEFAYAYFKRIGKEELMVAQEDFKSGNYESIDKLISNFIFELETMGYSETIDLVEELSARYLG